MALKIIEKVPQQYKKQLKFPYKLKAKGICIHNTANDASAENEVRYMQTNNLSTSFHFAVDDEKVINALPLDSNAWHAGDGLNGFANRNLIAIEICYSKTGGEKFLRAEKNAAKLSAHLCVEHGWTVKDISKHSDYTATDCPHRTVELGWKRFLEMVNSEIKRLTAESSELETLKQKLEKQQKEMAVLQQKLIAIQKIVN